MRVASFSLEWISVSSILIAGSIVTRSMGALLFTGTVTLHVRGKSSGKRAILWLISSHSDHEVLARSVRTGPPPASQLLISPQSKLTKPIRKPKATWVETPRGNPMGGGGQGQE